MIAIEPDSAAAALPVFAAAFGDELPEDFEAPALDDAAAAELAALIEANPELAAETYADLLEVAGYELSDDDSENDVEDNFEDEDDFEDPDEPDLDAEGDRIAELEAQVAALHEELAARVEQTLEDDFAEQVEELDARGLAKFEELAARERVDMPDEDALHDMVDLAVTASHDGEPDWQLGWTTYHNQRAELSDPGERVRRMGREMELTGRDHVEDAPLVDSEGVDFSDEEARVRYTAAAIDASREQTGDTGSE